MSSGTGTARLHTVNVVHALVADRRGDLDQTAIDKRPVTGRVRVGRLGVEGDQQYDTRHHGGVEQAVYAYAREDSGWWGNELGREIRPGQFGENLSTEGLDVTGAVVGEQWRVGTDGLVLAVTAPRVPCATFQGWLEEPRWVRRFTEHGAPGAYLRVLREGSAAAGDAIEVIHRPAHGVSIGEIFALRAADESRLRLLLEDPGTGEKLADAVRRDLAARARNH